MRKRLDEKFCVELGRRIKEVHNKGALTGARLCEILNVSRQQWNYIVNGKRMPTILFLVGFSKVYGVSIDKLVDGIELTKGYGDFLTRQQTMIDIIKKAEKEKALARRKR